MADLLTALAQHVESNTSLELGTDLFTSYEVPPDDDVPRNAVFMWESDGWAMPIPEMKPVSSLTKTTFCQDHMHVRVRRMNRQYSEGKNLFDDIIAALDLVKTGISADDIESFEWCKATKPKPQFKGPGDHALLIWDLVFERAYYRLITANP